MADDERRECAVCGEDCLGRDFVMIRDVKVYQHGEPHQQVYIQRNSDDGSWDYLHRWCVGIWLEGFWMRISSDAKFPGDQH